MRVLVIDELAEDLEERAETLRDGLLRAGHEVVQIHLPQVTA